MNFWKSVFTALKTGCLEKVEEGKAFAPANYFEYRIEGGNHAQFGNYGVQKGDGAAAITGPEQQQSTVDFIIQHY